MTQATLAVPVTSWRQEWNARAVQLAGARNMPAPRLLMGDTYRQIFTVGLGWLVVLVRPLGLSGGWVECQCTAGRMGRPCCHAGAVLSHAAGDAGSGALAC